MRSAALRQNRATDAACPKPGGTTATRRQSSNRRDTLAGESSNEMAAYLIRRILLMVPTLFGIMLVSFIVVQFAPGGPIERVIAVLQGADTSAGSRTGGAGGDFGAR